jgi:hypothetical protein
MSLRLRGLGLAVLAIGAVGAFAAMNASATVSGHFVSDAVGGHTIVNQSINPALSHSFNVSIEGGARIECEQASVQGTASTATMQAVKGAMTLGECHTEGAAPGTVTVHMNGCTGEGTSNSSGSGTGHLLCPVGKTVELTHPNCTIKVPPQTSGGFTYTNVTDEGKHTITVDVNSTGYTVHYESGICVFLGTTHTASITGSTIVRATDTNGQRVNITST